MAALNPYSKPREFKAYSRFSACGFALPSQKNALNQRFPKWALPFPRTGGVQKRTPKYTSQCVRDTSASLLQHEMSL